jgi:pimeloyl-ACP methyl ester carboxylesterase
VETKESLWNGFQLLEFVFEGHDAILVVPHTPTKDKRWLFKTEYFNAFPAFEIEMLEKGYYLAHVKNTTRWCLPEDTQRQVRFAKFLHTEFGLHEKFVTVGMSCGGMQAVYLAAAAPELVALCYIDAPVLDIRSWPGGKGKGCGSEKCWQECMECYGLAEETAKTFDRNPLDRAEELAKTGIPVIMVAGGADDVVPYDENGEIFVKRFRAAGGVIEEYVKPECGHHPHSLEDPTPIVDFLLGE